MRHRPFRFTTQVADRPARCCRRCTEITCAPRTAPQRRSKKPQTTPASGNGDRVSALQRLAAERAAARVGGASAWSICRPALPTANAVPARACRRGAAGRCWSARTADHRSGTPGGRCVRGRSRKTRAAQSDSDERNALDFTMLSRQRPQTMAAGAGHYTACAKVLGVPRDERGDGGMGQPESRRLLSGAFCQPE